MSIHQRAVAAACLLALASAAAAQETSPEESPPPEVPKVERATIVPPAGRDEARDDPPSEPPPARPAEARPGHHAVREVRLVKEGGGRVDGARQDDWIAFDMAGPDGRYDVYEMRLEIGVEKCLTCDNYLLNDNRLFKKVSSLNPAWHPSGEYLVIQVQGSPKRRGLEAADLATPHRALGCELWVIPRDGRDAWQITRVGERGGAVLDPHFSHEADLLVWSERLTSRQPPWGEWGLRVVEFRVKRGLPRLGDTRTFGSGIGYGLVVAHAFTPDDAGLWVSAIPERGLPEPDVLRLDLESGRTERLTSSPDQSDELISSVPYSDYLVWVTDRGLEPPLRSPLLRRSEVWLRSASGMAQERLTYFNDPGSSHYLGDAMIGDLSWTADGESLLVHVVSVAEGATEAGEGIYLVSLGEEYRR